MEDLIAIKLLNVYIARYPQNVPPCALIHFWAAEMAWSIIPLCWQNGKGLHEPGPPPFRLTTIRLCVLSLLTRRLWASQSFCWSRLLLLVACREAVA